MLLQRFRYGATWGVIFPIRWDFRLENKALHVSARKVTDATVYLDWVSESAYIIINFGGFRVLTSLFNEVGLVQLL